ncbi:hypothetical protein TRFO_25660 [Tritrichomonas foetus]|uniref:Uncharacterized protein n=1 Tax=Tritrichomonas foetus TaxID=1144522 RepID=A0A1J4K9E9_9EUKA|nr:hypothetical protein TRFO_25660 [Tritrichomonas foetus]|eukprot:OHT06316.1 hypothetical protein TRFO_25660 [Tritrichomonas foetus]
MSESENSFDNFESDFDNDDGPSVESEKLSSSKENSEKLNNGNSESEKESESDSYSSQSYSSLSQKSSNAGILEEKNMENIGILLNDENEENDSKSTSESENNENIQKNRSNEPFQNDDNHSSEKEENENHKSENEVEHNSNDMDPLINLKTKNYESEKDKSEKDENDESEKDEERNDESENDVLKRKVHQKKTELEKPKLNLSNKVDDLINIGSQKEEEEEENEPTPEKNDDSTFFTSNKSYLPNGGSQRRNVQTQSNTVFSTVDDPNENENESQTPTFEPKAKRQSVRKFGNNNTSLNHENSEKLESSENENQTQKKNPRKKPKDRMTILKERALNMENLDDLTNDEFESLISLLNEERKQIINNRKFSEGNKINFVINHVNKSYENKRKRELHKQEYNKYIEQKEEFEELLKRFDHETSEMLHEIDIRNREAIVKMEKQHEHESNEHYLHWMSDSKVRQYNRASQQLMLNRKQMQLLLDQCRFTEAEAIQQIINKQERREQANAHKAMQHDYDESLKALNEKQQNEIDFIIQKGRIRRQQLQQKRANERLTLMNKEKKINAIAQQVADPDRVWNLAQNQRINEIYKKKDERTLPPINTASVSTTSSTNTGHSLTARTKNPSTVIKLPPLIMRRPTRRSNLQYASESAR